MKRHLMIAMGWLFSLFGIVAMPLPQRYHQFDNIQNKAEALSIRCFAQDSLGIVWMGTLSGLYSYDGYEVRPYAYEGNLSVQCCVLYGHRIYLGGENGLMVLNLDNGELCPVEAPIGESVKALQLQSDTLWIGSGKGVFMYRLSTGECSPIPIQKGTAPKDVLSLSVDEENLYISTKQGVGRYSINGHTYQPFEYSFMIPGALFLDKSKQQLWVGTVSALLQVDLPTGKVTQAGSFPIVKTLCMDSDGNLLVGTDNGMYVCTEQGEVFHVTHDARNSSSIVGEVVWTIYHDWQGNLWMGTDNGVSLSAQESGVTNYPLPSITQLDEGNRIFCIQRDAERRLWLGGTRGMIGVEHLMEGNSTYRWFQMDNKQAPIRHNRIRKMYEDRQHNFWVATDVGLLWYDAAHKNFLNYTLRNSSNWVYDMLDNADGNLWLATYDGIICVKNEDFLKSSTVTPVRSFSQKNGLQGNDTYRMAFDVENNMWAITASHHLDYIDLKSNTVLPMDTLLGEDPVRITMLLGDLEGRIWVSNGNRVYRIALKEGKRVVDFATLTSSKSLDLYAVSEVEHSIWLTASEGIFVIDKEALNVRHLATTEKYLSVYSDTVSKCVWLGTTDKLVRMDPERVLAQLPARKLLITSVKVMGENNRSYPQCLTDKITLKHNQNTLQISLSDGRYISNKFTTFAFKLEGVHAQWVELKPGENSILLSNLTPGRYKLYVTNDLSLNRKQALPLLAITVRPPWYFSWPARCLYFLALAGLIWWVINFFNVRHRLRLEHQQRETLLEQAHLRMRFFTNLAHELKTPLSLIMAPSSKLLKEAPEGEERKLLELIYGNASKLSSLIHLSIEAYQDERKASTSFIPSEIEMVEFARCVFDFYKENQLYGEHDFVFQTNCDKVFLNVDAYKMESVLNNLLSNACKYTPAGGNILLELQVDKPPAALLIRVADTGIGIPEKEQPYIFQRYYQSSLTSQMPQEGTGVGLSMVKEYVEMHQGSVTVDSKENAGSTFLISLPLAANSLSSDGVPAEEAVQPAVGEEDKRPLVVIVEDNVSTANFIVDLLKKDYRCVVAHNGKNGLKLCLDLLPDLILTDAMMPIMDGLEMCRCIRQHVPLLTVPIILLTAKKDTQTECESAQLNIDAFIPKPFDCSLLQARIVQLLGKKERMEQQVRVEHIVQPVLNGEVSVDEKFLRRITKLIEDHLDEPDLSVEKLSQLSDVNAKQLYRKIKQLTNRTTVDYIRSIRVKKAALLFNNGNFTVAEVMYMVGFSNASYFTRCFKEEFEKTPQEYIASKKS